DLRGLLGLRPRSSLAGERFPKPRLRTRQSQEHARDGLELFWLERLGEINVGAVLQRLLSMILGNERRRDLNDRDDSRDRVLLDAATDIEPAHIRELHIEQHE